ncbi:hypothetical protein POTOM_045015 [Populus tomentosa]|uniref:Uncharacterized GPI-anchored protein At5g19230-like domain-containing protein n=1 Tax=Populus tomentosa TaxID=118781 RepID=A0A8X8CEX6_POPTO|nr:hypothetical protein POTOM_045015 [Populus tomentosa]
MLKKEAANLLGEESNEEDDLLQGLSSYRLSLTLPALAKNKNAGCLADKIADKLEDQPCTVVSPVQIESYPDLLSECGIDVNHTTEGLDHEDDWMVVVLTTSTPGGDFAGAISLVSKELLFLHRQFHLIEARPNAFVQNSLVSPALCNQDTKENLVTAFTFKENVCEEDNLLENINAYRTSLLGLSALAKNKKASCLAREIVDTLRNPCTADDDPSETLVNFQNYSRSLYEKYVNESSYGGAGVGANENWMVVVFVENTTSWTSAGGAKHSMVSEVGFGHCLASLLLGILLFHLVL